MRADPPLQGRVSESRAFRFNFQTAKTVIASAAKQSILPFFFVRRNGLLASLAMTLLHKRHVLAARIRPEVCMNIHPKTRAWECRRTVHPQVSGGTRIPLSLRQRSCYVPGQRLGLKFNFRRRWGLSDGRRQMQLRCSHALASRTTIQNSPLLVTASTANAGPAPFGVGAYYPAEVVTISGTSKEFTHAAATAGKSITILSTVRLNSLLETQQSARADRRCSRRDGRTKIPGPLISVFEQSKHDWVQIDGAVEHFRQSNRPIISN